VADTFRGSPEKWERRCPVSPFPYSTPMADIISSSRHGWESHGNCDLAISSHGRTTTMGLTLAVQCCCRRLSSLYHLQLTRYSDSACRLCKMPRITTETTFVQYCIYTK